MVTYERQDQILKSLNQKHFLKYEDLARKLFVSDATIRRDVHKLADRGLVTLVNGGVSINAEPTDYPYEYSSRVNHDEKVHIADLAKNLVQEGMAVYIDSGTTAFYFLKQLDKFQELSIVTNGLVVAREASKHEEWNINLVGGQLNTRLMNVSGLLAVENSQRFQFDAAFLSARAFNTNGPTDTNEQEASLKRAISLRTKEIVYLLDHTKFDRQQLYQSSTMTQVDYVVTDREPAGEIIYAAARNNVKIIY